ncbi:MAG: hypothetical protein ACT4P3_04580 [Betaproteobacteria bacterium]
MTLSDLVAPARVHRRVYTDPAIFEEERRRVFRRLWLWLGHDSQLKAPGDFITARMVRLLRMRVDRLAREHSPLDSPPARVNHHLSNVTVEEQGAGRLTGRACLLFVDGGHLRFAIPF